MATYKTKSGKEVFVPKGWEGVFLIEDENEISMSMDLKYLNQKRFSVLCKTIKEFVRLGGEIETMTLRSFY